MLGLNRCAGRVKPSGKGKALYNVYCGWQSGTPVVYYEVGIGEWSVQLLLDIFSFKIDRFSKFKEFLKAEELL